MVTDATDAIDYIYTFLELEISHGLIGFPFTFGLDPEHPFNKDEGSTGPASGLAGLTVDKSVEFSYEELATATDDFSLANKIGEGGFGAVYYAELRGEVCSHLYFYKSWVYCTPRNFFCCLSDFLGHE